MKHKASLARSDGFNKQVLTSTVDGKRLQKLTNKTAAAECLRAAQDRTKKQIIRSEATAAYDT